MSKDGEGDGYLPLFETKVAKGRVAYKLFASTIFAGICLILVYRLSHIPRAGEVGRWAWIGLFCAELWFSFYWIITQSVRWNNTCRYTFKERLSQRHRDKLPGVDIFVCTADPTMEPPMLVISTVLSVMAYDYPPEKLSVYLSDDGGSELTFYALLEASSFSKHWIPFCKKFKVEPRSPAAYFTQKSDPQDTTYPQEWLAMKKLYEDMKERIEAAVELGRISEEIREQHKGFSEWNSKVRKHDHQTILQVLIDGRNANAMDTQGHRLPTLVYLAREKRPQYHHNFKAGAMNALIRVSSQITNGSIILNVDCDMYSNNSESLRDALCFFMDEEKGHEIAYVQHPQNFENITKNDTYATGCKVVNKVELAGVDGYNGALYCGTGCFHRRESLSGRKYSKEYREWNNENERQVDRTISELEETAKMGLMYGCPVEDIITGLAIQCRGWKSVYYNPDIKGFLGVAPTTLDQALVQYKRWSEGMFQIFFSKYCPFFYGYGRIKLGLQMGYSKNAYSIAEGLWCGDTFRAWCTQQTMWVIRRTTAFLFAFVDTIIKQLGLSQTAFAITAKVASEDVSKRYQLEILEFGSSSPMFTIIATLALFHLFSLVGGLKRVILDLEISVVEQLIPQIVLCGLLVIVNIPVYEALFIRKDKGRMPTSVTFTSIVLASMACLIPMLSHIPRAGEVGRWAWIGLFCAELWFSFYWIITQSIRWNNTYRYTFKERLSQRHRDKLPGVDIFVCTADPTMEPPMLVINTVLSVMAYDYPPEKLSVYLSDDGGSELTFYALLEASQFSKQWIPFCKKFKVEPRSPAAYFTLKSDPQDTTYPQEWLAMKKLYEDMKERIEAEVELGRISEEVREKHKGFSEWNSKVRKHDHQTILQIRVSSQISNGAIILNVDCDMYSNNSESLREALCFFMDEEKGHEIAYVQHPQNFDNITNNDTYATGCKVVNKVELAGVDGYNGALYCGTGCFHTRESLCGRKFSKEYSGEWNCENERQMGLIYGCAIEDIITGLAIHCRGWKSIYYNPDVKGFLGVAPTTLDQALVQYKRWSEGMFQIFFSKYCPFFYGYGRIKLGLQMGYCVYLLWAPNSLPTLYYVVIPPLYLLRGIPLFPKISSIWFLPFAYVFVAKNAYSIAEGLWCGDTFRAWCTQQTMWVIRRTTAFLFAFTDTIIRQLGLSRTAYSIAIKVASEDVSKRYQLEILEFGSSSPMFTIIATLALFNLFSLVGGLKRVIMDLEVSVVEQLIPQFVLCGLLVIVNIPVYEALFIHKDKGRMPISVTFTSIVLASMACLIPMS
ncbi:hypothetical protein HHK36_005827 [Tetracentron sinense]|uniref:Cellulose synthase-like protein E6 n=1 Tax=Tetracentron sinense TaxID=13715 RepID=A0A834ZR24_TETSI|nr:hypothetical protein HHK36_005827 [Tetracentron sinense]